jgi:hypothetical protein
MPPPPAQHQDVHIELIRSLKALVEEHIALHRIEGFWQSFDRSRQTEFEHALGEKRVGQWLSPDIRHKVTPRAGEAWINSVVDMSDVEARDARMLSNGEIAFEMLADVEVVVETDTPADDEDAQQVAAWLTIRAEARWDSAISKRRGSPLTRTTASFLTNDPCSSWFDRTPISSISKGPWKSTVSSKRSVGCCFSRRAVLVVAPSRSAATSATPASAASRRRA